jgi:hypothetical protein
MRLPKIFNFSLRTKKNVEFDEYLIFEKLIHGYYAFEDNGAAPIALTAGVWLNISDQLNGVQENAGFTCGGTPCRIRLDLPGDKTNCHAKFEFNGSGSGTTNNLYEMRVYNATQARSIPIKDSRTAAGNDVIGFNGIAYDLLALTGDEYELQIRNVNNSNALTLTNAGIFCELSHYTTP